MAKSRNGQRTSSEGNARESTSFNRTKQFDKAIAALGTVNTTRVLATAQEFERVWKASRTNQDISPGFDFKQLSAAPGEYRVCQIRAGSDYRLAMTFLIGKDRAYWVHAWKKTRMNNRTETELAQQRAKALWDQLKREKKV